MTCTDSLTDFMMYIHFQHSDTIDFQSFVVKLATENTIFMCHEIFAGFVLGLCEQLRIEIDMRRRLPWSPNGLITGVLGRRSSSSFALERTLSQLSFIVPVSNAFKKLSTGAGQHMGAMARMSVEETEGGSVGVVSDCVRVSAPPT